MDHQSIWDPPVKISTPEVLRRIKSEKGGALRFPPVITMLLSISIWYLPKNCRGSREKELLQMKISRPSRKKKFKN